MLLLPHRHCSRLLLSLPGKQLLEWAEYSAVIGLDEVCHGYGLGLVRERCHTGQTKWSEELIPAIFLGDLCVSVRISDLVDSFGWVDLGGASETIDTLEEIVQVNVLSCQLEDARFSGRLDNLVPRIDRIVCWRRVPSQCRW